MKDSKLNAWHGQENNLESGLSTYRYTEFSHKHLLLEP